VAAKFFDQTQAVNVLLARVVQHMKLYQAAPEVAMVVSPMDTHPAELISSGHCARRNIIRSCSSSATMPTVLWRLATRPDPLEPDAVR
jgi:hypothetical protein